MLDLLGGSASSCKLMRQLDSTFSISSLDQWVNQGTFHGAVQSEESKPLHTSKFQVSAYNTSANTQMTNMVQVAKPIVNMWLSIFWESEHFGQ